MDQKIIFFSFFSIHENDILILYNDQIELYSEIKMVFTEQQFETYSLIDVDNDKNVFFSLFNYLYLDLFKEPSI